MIMCGFVMSRVIQVTQTMSTLVIRNLTFKVDPRTERNKICMMIVDP